jgi:hypothetical protein
MDEDFMKNNIKKKVDEDWIKEVENEKTKSEKEKPSPEKAESKSASKGPHEMNFTVFLSTMGLQAYVALGEIADPATNEKKVNVDQAKYMIDMLGLLDEKTKGNLNSEESKMLSSMLYELRTRYIEKSKA